MISTIKRHFFWPKLKANIVIFIVKCQECQLVKAKDQHTLGLLQPFPILEWKWEVTSMDFITSLLKRKKKNDSIFVVIEKLSKEEKFIPVKSTYKAMNIVNIFYMGCRKQLSQIEMLSLQENFGGIYSLD